MKNTTKLFLIIFIGMLFLLGCNNNKTIKIQENNIKKSTTDNVKEIELKDEIIKYQFKTNIKDKKAVSFIRFKLIKYLGKYGLSKENIREMIIEELNYSFNTKYFSDEPIENLMIMYLEYYYDYYPEDYKEVKEIIIQDMLLDSQFGIKTDVFVVSFDDSSDFEYLESLLKEPLKNYNINFSLNNVFENKTVIINLNSSEKEHIVSYNYDEVSWNYMNEEHLDSGQIFRNINEIIKEYGLVFVEFDTAADYFGFFLFKIPDYEKIKDTEEFKLVRVFGESYSEEELKKEILI